MSIEKGPLFTASRSTGGGGGTKLSYDELEDKYLALKENNLQLKKVVHAQEEKLKRLGTKLIRITADLKKRQTADGSYSDAVPVDAQGRIGDLEAALVTSQERARVLANKVAYYRQLLEARDGPGTTTGGRRLVPGLGKSNRVKTRLSASPGRRRAASAGANVRITHVHHHHHQGPTLDELLEQLPVTLEDSLSVEDQNRLLDLVAELRSRVLKLESTSADPKENVPPSNGEDYAGLRRELRDKAAALAVLQDKLGRLEGVAGASKDTHGALIAELESLNAKWKDEVTRRLAAESRARDAAARSDAVSDLEAMLDDLRRDKSLLEAENAKLLARLFAGAGPEDPEATGSKLAKAKEEIAMLRSQLDSARVAAASAATASSDSAEHARLKADYAALSTAHETLKSEIQDMRTRLASGGLSALVDLGFLTSLPNGATGDAGELAALRLAHAEAQAELERLKAQLTAAEAELESAKASALEAHDARVVDAANADARAARIQALERQLRELLYGGGGGDAAAAALRLLEGVGPGVSSVDALLTETQNALELHVTSVALNPAAWPGSDPMSFLVWEYYEHEPISTGVLAGLQPKVDHATRYVFEVDELALRYHATSSMALDVYAAVGESFEHRGRAQVSFKELATRPLPSAGPPLTYTATLTSPSDGRQVIATVNYSLRLAKSMARSTTAAVIAAGSKPFPVISSTASAVTSSGSRSVGTSRPAQPSSALSSRPVGEAHRPVERPPPAAQAQAPGSNPQTLPGVAPSTPPRLARPVTPPRQAGPPPPRVLASPPRAKNIPSLDSPAPAQARPEPAGSMRPSSLAASLPRKTDPLPSLAPISSAPREPTPEPIGDPSPEPEPEPETVQEVLASPAPDSPAPHPPSVRPPPEASAVPSPTRKIRASSGSLPKLPPVSSSSSLSVGAGFKAGAPPPIETQPAPPSPDPRPVRPPVVVVTKKVRDPPTGRIRTGDDVPISPGPMSARSVVSSHPPNSARSVVASNAIVVSVESATELHSVPGTSAVPRAAVRFAMYNNEPQTTAVAPASRNPVWNFTSIFPEDVTQALEEYLWSRALEFDVIDDRSGDLIGRASVPMDELLGGKVVQGSYDIADVYGGGSRGELSVRIGWEHAYVNGRAWKGDRSNSTTTVSSAVPVKSPTPLIAPSPRSPVDVSSPPPSARHGPGALPRTPPPAEEMTVTVHSVELAPELLDEYDLVGRSLFVTYSVLNSDDVEFNGEVDGTGQVVFDNARKTFQTGDGEEMREAMVELVGKDGGPSEAGTVMFMVYFVPGSVQSLGLVSVDLNKVLALGQDLDRTTLSLKQDGIETGSITITMSVLASLRAAQLEWDRRKDM